MKYPPAPQELRAWMDQHGLSSRQVGDMLDVSSRTVRNWTSAKANQEIPLACWFMLRTLMGEPTE